MCRMLLEVGDYASTILDRVHQAFSRKCLSINKKVEKELIKRKAVGTPDDIYVAPTERIDSSDLSALSIAQLETLYRQSRSRFRERLHDRRETLTRFFETRIVNEMKSRQNVTAVEQLKIDYCDRTNRDELHNISAILQIPIGKVYLDIDRCETPREMINIIENLRRYRTVAEREMLIETVDKAIDFIDHNRNLGIAVNLAASLVELDASKIVSCPKWIDEYMLNKVNVWKKQPFTQNRDMVVPFLTAYSEWNDTKARWRAVRILNTCYGNCLASGATTDVISLIEDMYLVEQCCTFVTRYNVRKLAAVWNRCCDAISSSSSFQHLTTSEIWQLLFVANAIADYAPISPDHREALCAILSDRATTGDFEAEIYSRFHNSKSNEYAPALKKA